jgi:hypothetical protein
VGGQSLLIAVPIGSKFLLIKTLRNSDDGAAFIAYGSDPHQHVHRMSFFVAQLHFRLVRLALVHGSGERTSRATADATLAITVHENIVPARAPDDLVLLVSGKPFSALIPEQDFPVSIGN